MAAHAVVHTEAGLCVIDDDEKGSQDHSLSDKWLAATVAADGTKLLSAACEERIYPPYASGPGGETLPGSARASHPPALSLPHTHRRYETYITRLSPQIFARPSPPSMLQEPSRIDWADCADDDWEASADFFAQTIQFVSRERRGRAAPRISLSGEGDLSPTSPSAPSVPMVVPPELAAVSPVRTWAEAVSPQPPLPPPPPPTPTPPPPPPACVAVEMATACVAVEIRLHNRMHYLRCKAEEAAKAARVAAAAVFREAAERGAASRWRQWDEICEPQALGVVKGEGVRSNNANVPLHAGLYTGRALSCGGGGGGGGRRRGGAGCVEADGDGDGGGGGGGFGEAEKSPVKPKKPTGDGGVAVPKKPATVRPADKCWHDLSQLVGYFELRRRRVAVAAAAAAAAAAAERRKEAKRVMSATMARGDVAIGVFQSAKVGRELLLGLLWARVSVMRTNRSFGGPGVHAAAAAQRAAAAAQRAAAAAAAATAAAAAALSVGFSPAELAELLTSDAGRRCTDFPELLPSHHNRE